MRAQVEPKPREDGNPLAVQREPKIANLSSFVISTFLCVRAARRPALAVQCLSLAGKKYIERRCLKGIVAERTVMW